MEPDPEYYEEDEEIDDYEEEESRWEHWMSRWSIQSLDGLSADMHLALLWHCEKVYKKSTTLKLVVFLEIRDAIRCLSCRGLLTYDTTNRRFYEIYVYSGHDNHEIDYKAVINVAMANEILLEFKSSKEMSITAEKYLPLI